MSGGLPSQKTDTKPGGDSFGAATKFLLVLLIGTLMGCQTRPEFIKDELGVSKIEVGPKRKPSINFW